MKLSRAGRIGQLVERVLAVDEVELVAVGHGSRVERNDLDPLREASLGHVLHRSRDRVGLELDADEPAGRIALGHRQEPAPATTGDVQDTSTRSQPLPDLLQAGQALVEEERDVLHGDALDGPVVARGALGDRAAGPEELGQVGVVQGRIDAAHELAAQIVGRVLVEQDLGEGRSDREAKRLLGRDELNDAVGVGATQPEVRRGRMDRGRPRELIGGDAACPCLGHGTHELQLDAEREEPAAVEPDEALDELVEVLVEVVGRDAARDRHDRKRTSRAHLAAGV
jgi:hypothetical protein